MRRDDGVNKRGRRRVLGVGDGDDLNKEIIAGPTRSFQPGPALLNVVHALVYEYCGAVEHVVLDQLLHLAQYPQAQALNEVYHLPIQGPASLESLVAEVSATSCDYRLLS